MLLQYKKLYENIADNLAEWKTIPKSKLCTGYIKAAENNNTNLADTYLSAIICRYWSLLDKQYHHSYIGATQEDVYDWFINGILYALKNKVWLNPDNKLYNDPNGADKVIHSCIKSARLTYFQALNRQKRKVNSGIQSIDKITEDNSNNNIVADTYDFDNNSIADVCINHLVEEFFNKKDYFIVFLLYSIMHKNVFTETILDNNIVREFNINKTAKTIKDLNILDFYAMHTLYNIPLEALQDAFKYFDDLSVTRLATKVKKSLDQLKRHTYIKTLKEGN